MSTIETQSRGALAELIALLQDVDRRWASAEWNLLGPDDVVGARNMLAATEQLARAADRSRQGRLLPIDVLARDFHLSELAVAVLVVVCAPRLRGELARLFGILANDPGRPLIDEHLIDLEAFEMPPEPPLRLPPGDQPTEIR